MINYRECDGQSLIHAINLLPFNQLIGAEIGMGYANTFCTFLDMCPNIKTLYGVDPYKPYTDTIHDEPLVMTFDMIYSIKVKALTNIVETGKQEKVLFIEDNSENAAELIPDGELDFIFVDSYISVEQIYEELQRWYPKVKFGGIFAGHDFESPHVQTAVLRFREENNIKNNMSVFDQTFSWIK